MQEKFEFLEEKEGSDILTFLGSKEKGWKIVIKKNGGGGRLVCTALAVCCSKQKRKSEKLEARAP